MSLRSNVSLHLKVLWVLTNYITVGVKFELTNQDSASGKKCTAPMLTVKTAKAFEVGQRFLLEIPLNRHKKGFTNLKKPKQIVK